MSFTPLATEGRLRVRHSKGSNDLQTVFHFVLDYCNPQSVFGVERLQLSSAKTKTELWSGVSHVIAVAVQPTVFDATEPLEPPVTCVHLRPNTQVSYPQSTLVSKT